MGNANTVDQAVELLENEDGVARACESVEAWAKDGRWQDLVALAKALEAGAPSEKDARARFESVVDHVEDQLALCAGDAAVDALLALLLIPRERSVSVPRSPDQRFRAFASRLGFGQDKQVFLGALERAGSRPELHELFACWMHEVVLRGVSLANEARAKTFREDVLVRNKHALAALPLELRDTEREAPSYMPLYGSKGFNRAVEALTSGPMSAATVPPPADGAAVRVTRLEDAALAERMTAAVRPWVTGSNGKVEAEVFELDPIVSRSAAGRWLLRALPLDSTTATARLEVARTEADGVFGPLFSAASNGGAYSSGFGGAYGRLAAWESLGALVGAPPGAGIDAIAKLAAASAFLTFRAAGPWFHDVAWDLGALVLRADGKTAAVLAATDTD